MSHYPDKNNDQGGDQKRETLYGEIIDDGDSGQNSRQYTYRRYNAGYGQSWILPPVDNGGCLASFITFSLFMICLGQYGLLAAIGFFVFHLIGSIMGGVHSARQLMRGLPASIWAWRAGNWIISFFVTVWFAGGFEQ